MKSSFVLLLVFLSNVAFAHPQIFRSDESSTTRTIQPLERILLADVPCTIACWGKFSPDQDVVCNASGLQECIQLSYCTWTCK
jgi:hypothetical protein